ncbi:OmpA family protein [Photobacterium piscicola]|uniref:OmpA family protein n=1 Tax=Photobacterium piscicola TaxID=1378299 RepID=UPI003735D99A
MINNKYTIINKAKKMSIFFTFTLLSPIVVASELVSVQGLITYPSAWMSGSLGVGKAENNSLQSLDGISPSFKLMVGYDVNRYLGMYSSYDFIDSILKDKSINIFSLGFKGNLPVFDMWSVFGKVGISYLNGNTNSYNVSGSVGLGVEYKITNSISTKIGYDYYQNIDLIKSNVGLNKIYWGMIYRFGQVSLPIIKSQQIEIVNTTISDISDISVLTRKNYIISFPTGQSILDYDDKYILAELLTVMHNFPEVIAKITGRADATGNALINDEISKARSLSAYRYLISHGISSDRLVREWLSDSSPIDNNSPKNSELERSVQIVLY